MSKMIGTLIEKSGLQIRALANMDPNVKKNHELMMEI